MNEKNHKILSAGDLMVLIPVAILLIVQLPHLSLPYFWDEAWSYMVAVRKMAEAGPSLLPGAVPIDYCKGHPQLFYFLSACWFNLFSGEIWSMRFFALIVSIGLLIVFYFGVRKISNQPIAAMGVVLLGVQSMFLAQSIMVLPEMMIALFLLLAVFSFARSKYAWYALWGSLMVLTKETALIFAGMFFLYYVLLISGKQRKESFNWKTLFLIAAPVLVYFVFLIAHKIAFGVFFYPEHWGFISFEWKAIWKKLGSAFVTVFVHYGRVSMLIFIVGILLFLLVRKATVQHSKALISLSLLFVAYLFFLSLNFYSPRYTLALLVLEVLVFAILVDSLNVPIFVKWAVTLSVSFVCLFYSLTSKREIDIDLGYIEVVEVNRDVVRYCEQSNYFAEPIATSFNMNFCLKEKTLGYILGEKEFAEVAGLDHYKTARYVILETTTGDSDIVEWVKTHYLLRKSFANKHAFAAIYENPEYKPERQIP